jgi:hypothetical protein
MQLTFLSRKNKGFSKPRKHSKSNASAKTLPATKLTAVMVTNSSAGTSNTKLPFKPSRKFLEKLRAFFHLERKTTQEPVRPTAPNKTKFSRFRQPMKFKAMPMKGDPCRNEIERMRKQIREEDILETSSIIPLDINIVNEELEEDYKAKYDRLYTRPTKPNWIPMSSVTTTDNSQGTETPQTCANPSPQVGKLMDYQFWELSYASDADVSIVESDSEEPALMSFLQADLENDFDINLLTICEEELEVVESEVEEEIPTVLDAQPILETPVESSDISFDPTYSEEEIKLPITSDLGQTATADFSDISFDPTYSDVERDLVLADMTGHHTASTTPTALTPVAQTKVEKVALPELPLIPVFQLPTNMTLRRSHSAKQVSIFFGKRLHRPKDSAFLPAKAQDRTLKLREFKLCSNTIST